MFNCFVFTLSAIYVFTVAEYWALGCLFLFMDLTGKPAFLTQYKVQENETKVCLKNTLVRRRGEGTRLTLIEWGHPPSYKYPCFPAKFLTHFVCTCIYSIQIFRHLPIVDLLLKKTPPNNNQTNKQTNKP